VTDWASITFTRIPDREQRTKLIASQVNPNSGSSFTSPPQMVIPLFFFFL
jgi:hypothetical protein